MDIDNKEVETLGRGIYDPPYKGRGIKEDDSDDSDYIPSVRSDDTEDDEDEKEENEYKCTLVDSLPNFASFGASLSPYVITLHLKGNAPSADILNKMVVLHFEDENKINFFGLRLYKPKRVVRTNKAGDLTIYVDSFDEYTWGLVILHGKFSYQLGEDEISHLMNWTEFIKRVGRLDFMSLCQEELEGGDRVVCVQTQ